MDGSSDHSVTLFYEEYSARYYVYYIKARERIGLNC